MSTLMACFPEALMNQETAFHQKLSRAEWYQVGGGKLFIYTSDSEHILYLGVFVVKSNCIGVKLVQSFCL